ncbi:hypothetical protein GCM10009864_48390 [Streptomyces lunalinharesii]|uniref:Uncharacterized protein n=1 Tax=Streptomyces lunalinharesii TaxID=333384 RepID=A0ABN3SCG9_9ACTN
MIGMIVPRVIRAQSRITGHMVMIWITSVTARRPLLRGGERVRARCQGQRQRVRIRRRCRPAPEAHAGGTVAETAARSLASSPCAVHAVGPEAVRLRAAALRKRGLDPRD